MENIVLLHICCPLVSNYSETNPTLSPKISKYKGYYIETQSNVMRRFQMLIRIYQLKNWLTYTTQLSTIMTIVQTLMTSDIKSIE